MWKVSILFLMPIMAKAQIPELSWLDESQWNDDQLEVLREEISYYSNYPMSIQSSDPLYLEKHPLISLTEAINIAKYIDEAGLIFDWGEMTNVYGIDEEWVERRKPYLSLEPIRSNWHLKPTPWRKVKLSLGLKLDDFRKRGYREREYLGTPFQDQGALSISGRNYSVNLRWQRDAGERWTTPEKVIYDHVAMGLVYRPHRALEIGIGNYRIGRFLGTHVGSRFGSSIPTDISGIQARSSQTRTTASAAEFGLWKGLNGSADIHSWLLQAQCGYATFDGRIEDQQIASVIQSGLHRTEVERSRRNTILGRHLGWEVQKSFSSFRLGMAQDLFQIKPTNSDYYNLEGGQSLYLQILYYEDFIEIEWASNLQFNSAVQCLWTRHLGDLQFGLRGYYSELGFHNGFLRPSGWFFTQGKELSIATLIAYNRGNNYWNTTLFNAYQRDIEWVSKRKSGIQLSYANGRYSPSFKARYRFTAHENWGTHFSQFSSISKLNTGEITLRFNSHFNSIAEGTIGAAIDYQFELQSFKWLIRARVQKAGEDMLPIYFMQPTTQLQMQIQSLSRTGYGVDLLTSWHGSQQFSLQLQSSIDYQPNVKSRGSGNDLVESPIKWGLTFEAHWKFSARTD